MPSSLDSTPTGVNLPAPEFPLPLSYHFAPSGAAKRRADARIRTGDPLITSEVVV